MTDWADEITDILFDGEASRETGMPYRTDVAAALRAAELRGRVAGMHEMIDRFESGIAAVILHEEVDSQFSKLSPTT